MPVRKHKVRVVSVRFTQDEYEALTRACEAQESRSLSEFTRTAMKERLALAAVEGRLLDGDVDVVARRLEKLYEELRSATERMGEMLGRR